MASIKARGDRWRARVLVNGRQVERTFATHDQARMWATITESAAMRGEIRDFAGSEVTFVEYASAFLAQQGRWKASSITMMEARLRLHVHPVLGMMGLRYIRRSHCRAVVELCQAKGLSPRTTRAVVSVLSAVLALAVDDELIQANPAQRLRLPKPSGVRRELLTVEQVTAIRDRIAPDLRAMVVLGVGSAMRSSEMRGLVAANVTPPVHLSAVQALDVDGLVKVTHALQRDGSLGAPKSTSSLRDIPVPAVVVSALRDHVRTFGLVDGLVFHHDGAPMSQRYVTQEWHKAAQGLNVPAGEVWHALRRYAASQWLANGVSVATVSKVLGHSSPTVTMSSYAFAVPSDHDRMLAASVALVEGLG